MTAEREAMTERQAWEKYRAQCTQPTTDLYTGFVAGYRAAAIANLSRAAEPVCTCPSGDGSLRWPCPRHPPEPARDAKRLDWLVRKIPGLTVRKIVGYLPYTGDLDVWRERIDAAMAQESDNG